MPCLSLATGPIEYVWVAEGLPPAATVVMLHEGLGSVSMWRDFPRRLADCVQHRVLAYSRQGYGGSARLVAPRAPSYMHDEALVVLPALLAELDIERPILFGHSDGASIALIHAARHPVRGVIALAPHVFVEELSIRNIAAAKLAYETTDLRARLARHHADVDGAFRGWNDAWLQPAFRDWNIEAFLPDIDCPVLVIQGQDDEYGTEEQLRRIQKGARTTDLLLLPDCGHSPHRDQPEKVLESVSLWMSRRVHGRPLEEPGTASAS